MLILLPPSEGKTAAVQGDPVDPAALWLPALAPARKRVMTRLVTLCKRTSAKAQDDSLRTLGLSPNQAAELARNAQLATAPAAQAADVYSGVLYEALAADTLAPPAREWLDESVVVFSGLWGVVRLADRIPAYRCSVGATLPEPVGGLTAYWKIRLKKQLDAAAKGQPVLDLRSGAYAAMWSPPGPLTAAVRVLHERIIGGVAKRSVVSHFNKATKGRLVRALAECGAKPGSVAEAVAVLRDLGFTVEESPGQLDVIVSEL